MMGLPKSNRAVALLLAISCMLACASCRSAAPAADEKSIAPLLSRYCYGCHGNGKHKGDVRLDSWKDESTRVADKKLWERVMQVVQNHEMPPENQPQPNHREREQLTRWIERTVFDCDCDHPDPGRVTLRRLNRAEYNNTIRDLLGVDVKPAEDFPVDDSGYGFDNIGDALSMPPVLLEKYLAAAQNALELALGANDARPSKVQRFPVDLLEVGYNAKQRGDGWVALNSIEEDDVAVKFKVTVSGEYAWRVHAYARQDSSNAVILTLMAGHRPLKIVEVETNATTARVYETRARLEPGMHRLRAVVRRIKAGLTDAEALKWKTGTQQKGAVFVEWLEVEGPLGAPTPSAPKTRERIFVKKPAHGMAVPAAREILRKFARRAYRRPPAAKELERLLALTEAAWKRGDDFERGVTVALQAVLVSPHFLFRGELQPEPDNPKAVHPVNEYALASRLSYFLWSSMPDERLFALAERGALRRSLTTEVKRMLQDPKSNALVENFAGQWLQIRNLDTATPDRDTFKQFDDGLRSAMRRETELLFETILREDRSVLEFLSADYTFVNERLAQHYGLKLLPGQGDQDAFRRVSLRGTQRRGVLTHGSVLTLTSNPARTSPVKRGKWVLENLLNSPPPPPPPNVPELKEGKELQGTLRDRMVQHRADPLCASCHARMDPIGFSLEHFDGIGGWRDQDGGSPIDASGSLVTGEAFDGAGGLTDLLLKNRKEQFVRCLADRLLTYALGRGLEYFDKCALDEIKKRTARRNYRFSTLLLEIVKSTPFQKRRGDPAAGHDSASTD